VPFTQFTLLTIADSITLLINLLNQAGVHATMHPFDAAHLAIINNKLATTILLIKVDDDKQNNYDSYCYV
jgi:hypothetical protein